MAEWLCPQIGVVTSDDAESLAARNGLSFTDLLLPFSQLPFLCQIKDPQNPGATLTMESLKVEFRDLRRGGFLASPRLLHSVLSERLRPAAHEGGVGGAEWFGRFQDGLLQWGEGGDHEFLRHYLACLLVVSTAHPDPLEQLQKLSQAQHALQHMSNDDTREAKIGVAVVTPDYAARPKWFVPNIFKFHLLIHDPAFADEQKAESVYASMKMTYGAHAAHLLRLNSGAASAEAEAPDPWRLLVHNKYRGLASGVEAPASIDTPPPVPLAAAHPFHVSDSAANLNGRGVTPPPPPLTGELSGSTTELNSPVPVPQALEAEQIPHALSSADLTAAVGGISIEAPPATQESFVFLGPRIGGSEPNAAGEEKSFGSLLTASDRDRIALFVQEFVQRGLLGFVERQMRLLHDQVSSRSRLGKSLLSVTKNWLGRSPGAPTSAASSPALASPASSPSLPSYAAESAEMQGRRLADLAFLFHHFSLAFGLYQSLKKDFAADSAWLHYAGALEMAGLCARRLGPEAAGRAYPAHYADAALSAYAATCGRPLLAGRAALISTQGLGELGRWAEAAAQLIRMTNGEWDLWSALFLERASACFVQAAMPRKAALHKVLAGHRFAKAQHRVHALRCYSGAGEEYRGKGWSLAEDHIWYTIGHQAVLIENTAVAVDAFARLLHEQSKQTQSQQTLFLNEFLAALKNECGSDDTTTLGLPTVAEQATVTAFGGCAGEWDWEESLAFADTTPRRMNETWERLETAALAAHGLPASRRHLSRPFLHKASHGATGQPDTQVGEELSVSLSLSNPLGIPLGLQGVRLELHVDGTEAVGSEEAEWVLGPLESRRLRLSLRPDAAWAGRQLTITGLRFRLCPVTLDEHPAEPNRNTWRLGDGVSGRLPLSVRGRRLHGTQAERSALHYAPDWRLRPLVSARPLPLLRAELEALAGAPIREEDGVQECLAGELLPYRLTLCDASPGTAPPISRLSVVADPMGSISVFTEQGRSCPENTVRDGFPVHKEHGVVNLLQPGTTLTKDPTTWQVWLRSPEGSSGEKAVQIIILYSCDGEKRHRRLRRWVRLDTESWVSTAARSSGAGAITLQLRNRNSAADAARAELVPLRLSGAAVRLLSQPTTTPLGPGELENVCLRLDGASDEVRLSANDSELPLPVRSNGVVRAYPAAGKVTVIKLLWKMLIRMEDGNQREAIGESTVPATDPSFVTPSPTSQPFSLKPDQRRSSSPVAKQIRVTIVASASECHHDFSAHRLASVDVSVDLRLVPGVDGRAVEVEWQGDGGKGLAWAGRSRGSAALRAEGLRVSLRAQLAAPGLHQLSASLSLRARRGSGAWAPLTLPPAFLTLHAAQ